MDEIDLVIFDCDGVLVESEHITCGVLADAVAELGLPWGTPSAISAFRGGSLPVVMERIERDLGRPAPEDFVPRFRERLFATLEAECRAVPGIEDALDALERPYCVASNGPHEKMHATLGTTGLLSRFDGRIFSAYDTGRFKPDPELFVRAAAAFGARAERCVVVEDTEHGLAAARDAGMAAVAYVEAGRIVDVGDALELDDMRKLGTRLEAIAKRW